MSRMLLAAASALILGCTYRPPAADVASLLPSCPSGQTLVGADGGQWTCFDPSGVHLANVASAESADSAAHAAHAGTSHHAEQAQEADGFDAVTLVLGDGGPAIQDEALEVFGTPAITSGGVIPVGLASAVADAGAGPGTSTDTAALQQVSISLQHAGEIHVLAHGTVVGSGAAAANTCSFFIVVTPNPDQDCVPDSGDDHCPFDQSQQSGGELYAALGPASFSLMSSAHLPAGNYVVYLEVTTQPTTASSSCVLSAPATLDVELN